MYEQIPPEIFEIGILNREYHERLLMGLEGYAKRAGIPEEYVWARLSQFCTDDEAKWVKNIRKPGIHGLCYVGTNADKPTPSGAPSNPAPVEDRMMAIAGACLRNYIDAKVMDVQAVLSALEKDTMPTPTVLLIPNFCLDKGEGGSLPQWKIANLLGLLYSRLAAGLRTVIYVGDMKTLEMEYGKPFRKHIETHYTLL